MDTTSHNFAWQSYMLGDATGSSVLYDVAIVSEDPPLAYAVGQIYRNDTTFNAAKWNGYTWELIQIQFLYFCDQSDTFPFPAQAVWAFGENDIWIASGSQIARWNGQNQTSPVCIPVSVNKLWGENSSSMYAVGYGGGIAHYNGSSWTKMESGTTLTLLDVFGRSSTEIYICGGNYSTGQGIVLKYNGIQCTKLIDSYYFGGGFDSTQLFKTQLYGPIDGVWVDERGKLFAVGDLIYEFYRGQWNYARGVPDNTIYSTIYTRGYTKAIRGYKSNDLVFAGERSTTRHFNGVSWQQIGEPYDYLSNIDWYGVDRKEDMIVTVGRVGTHAGVTILHR